MRIKLIITLLVLVTLFLMAGCSGGSYRITVGGIDTSDNSMSGNYSSFSGYYFKSMTFKQGETVDFQILLQTDSGELSAKFIDSTGSVVEELDQDKQIRITKTDKYKVQVEGQSHKGSFMITWNKQN